MNAVLSNTMTVVSTIVLTGNQLIGSKQHKFQIQENKTMPRKTNIAYTNVLLMQCYSLCHFSSNLVLLNLQSDFPRSSVDIHDV